jgi:hypothetical protein
MFFFIMLYFIIFLIFGIIIKNKKIFKLTAVNINLDLKRK